MLRLYDTATRGVHELEYREPGKASLYVCGSTVYGPPHIGHGRFVLVFDILRRYLEYRGHDVDHVSNVTDIDDKIINRANEESRRWQEVAEQYEAAWWESMDALGALRPSSVPHATAFIDEMVELVGELVSRGVAYETGDGVYLSVAGVEGYGLLLHQPLESLRSGSRVAVDEAKRAPFDFALWKKAKPGEPTWSSPFGDGRPGWHTECVVMSLGLLGEGFDLHGGGQDLIFPHHENERAQAVALGKRFANHWMHNAMVEVGGEKMSKSLGNFTTIDQLLEGTDPRAYRTLVARSHYQSPIEVAPEQVRDAEKALARVDSFARRYRELSSSAAPSAFSRPAQPGDPASGGRCPASELEERFVERMDDNLDTAGALGRLFSAVREANAAADRGDAAFAVELGGAALRLLGVLGIEPGRGRYARVSVSPAAGAGEGAGEGDADGGEIDEATAELVRRRDEARTAKDFARADHYRDRLVALGWTVEDAPGGTRVFR